MKSKPSFEERAEAIRRQAVQSLFELFESSSEGAVAVDGDARVVWMNEKYAHFLGLGSAEETLGRPVEDVIPNSLMRQVVETGRPILLDIMHFQGRPLVVTRFPLHGEDGETTGAVGFVLYGNVEPLTPLVSTFARLQDDLDRARRELAEQRGAKYTFAQFIGSSAACMELKRQARRAARIDTTVLLLGETGTGKELLAHAIHAASARAGGPIVGVNVSAVPENLLESEFFGAVSGAYTGADPKGREGKLKLADGGTLFLDEVGDMPLRLQSKLLRALQEQEFEPLGSDKVVRVNVRVIAATSRDLKAMVAEGSFRSDLYYRLNVLPLTLPPLRERLEDLEALCDALLGQMAARTGDPLREISPQGLAVLAGHSWPGNVRELRNVLERAAMLSDRIRLGAQDFEGILPGGGRAVSPELGPREARPLADVLAEAERGAIRAALEAAAGRKTVAARLLGISRATLYEKLSTLGDMSG
ncbi:MAG: sigma 54-interacting transcriptional regulator [Deltaproteobacteria bacterium]|nr:sigma 54-interacting transcriptional regulator [Deltaproteobacteria bacterium]